MMRVIVEPFIISTVQNNAYHLILFPKSLVVSTSLAILTMRCPILYCAFLIEFLDAVTRFR